MDKRLLTVASLVRPGKVFCDVGTDHAYLPVWLVEQGITPRAIACDVNVRPLETARRTVTEAGLSEKIELLLSDGLAELSPDAAEDIAIAGMGGELIARILLECDWAKDSRYRFLLQPMTRAADLRRILCENGFSMEREIPVIDGTHRYTVMQVSFTGDQCHPEELFCRTGRIPEEATAEAAAWLRGEAERERRIAVGLRHAIGKETEAESHAALADRIEEQIREEYR